MEANLRSLSRQQPSGEGVQRYAEVARLLTGRTDASPGDGIAWVRSLVADLQIPPLRIYGITTAHTAELVQNAARASSMKANPVTLSPEELAAVLEQAL
jgi:alcohol dehydrogenase class IV